MKISKVAMMLALLGATVGSSPAPVVTPTAGVTAPAPTKSTPAVTPVSARQVALNIGNVPFIAERGNGAIWAGSAKRGARKGRSRWNYNR